MITIKKLGIWMNHTNSHLIDFSEEHKAATTISADFATRKNEKNNQSFDRAIQCSRQLSQQHFYKNLTASIKDFSEVVLFGPTNAKTELFRFIRKDNRYDNINVAVLQSGKISDKQLAFVQEYFKRCKLTGL